MYQNDRCKEIKKKNCNKILTFGKTLPVIIRFLDWGTGRFSQLEIKGGGKKSLDFDFMMIYFKVK